jgi:hypothetical protein
MTASLTTSPTQHGFRPFRSTTTALLPLVNMISEGFNRKEPADQTVIVALDLSKAFDTVDLTLLLKQIAATDLHPNLVRWLATYLRGRSAACIYLEVKSKSRTVHIGVPQGSVLSPALFNFFVSDFPVAIQDKTSFANDFSIAATGPNLQVINKILNEDMKNIAAWAARKRLRISPDKSQAIYFTPHNKEFKDKPEVYFEGSLIPVNTPIKILGILFDTMHTFTPHAKAQKAKGSKRVPLLKAVMGAGWGLKKEDGLTTFKAFIFPVLGYGGPIFYPARSKLKDPVGCLQKVQNDALHVVTGCHAAASEQHLHEECKVLPVADHISMQCAQFFANTKTTNHPSSKITNRPHGDRPTMKPTLQYAFNNRVSKHINDNGVIPEIAYKKVLTTIHTETVSAVLSRRKPNRVLGFSTS